MASQSSTRDKPRVGFVVHVMQVAGAEILITKIIERLKDKIDPTVFCLDSLGLLGQRLSDDGVPVVVLNRSPGIDTSLPLRFSTELRRRRIDVLHAHQYTPFFYSALAKAYGAWRVKVIFTEHGRHFPDIVSWRRRLANRAVLSRMSYARTACCDFSARAVESVDGFQKVETVRNGVDFKAFPPRDSFAEHDALRRILELEPDLLYVACIARFHPVKDHPTLLHAWARLQSRVPKARLLLIGEGQQKDDLVALAENLGISSTVKFLGVRHDVADFLRAVDVFTLTSVSEASSLTLLEALASECPVVITDVGGNAEHVNHGIEGWLVPRQDHKQLAAQLEHVLLNPDLRKTVAKQARQRVEREFSLDDTIRQYENLYLSAVRGNAE